MYLAHDAELDRLGILAELEFVSAERERRQDVMRSPPHRFNSFGDAQDRSTDRRVRSPLRITLLRW